MTAGIGNAKTNTELLSFGSFRCTQCQNLIAWEVSSTDIGLHLDEVPVAGAIYPYSRCHCGYGRFVVYEDSSEKQTVKDGTTATSPPIETYQKIKDAKYAHLPVDEVSPNPHQPRQFFDAEALRGLSKSIRTIGQLEDVLVRPVIGGYELVLGERRWRAVQLAGLPEISAKIVELDDEEVRVISLVENIHRQDLTKVEEAFAFKTYVDEGQLIHQVGDQFGGMEGRVAEGLKVLNSNYFVKFQDEQIQELQRTVDQLRQRVREIDEVSYEAIIVIATELVGYLAEGYEVAAALPDGAYALRRKRPGMTSMPTERKDRS